MRLFWLLMLLLLRFSGSAQNRTETIVFSGIVKPADTGIGLKGLYRACIDIEDHMGASIMQVITDDSGHYSFELLKGGLINCIAITVHARSGQKQITTDSICPYAYTRTRSGYYDAYVGFCLDTLNNRTKYLDFLMQAAYEPVPGFGTVYFKKGSTNFASFAGNDSATICSCLSAFIKKHLSQKRNLQMELQGYAAADEAPGLATARAELVRQCILKAYGTVEPIPDIQISAHVSTVNSASGGTISADETNQAYLVRCLLIRLE